MLKKKKILVVFVVGCLLLVVSCLWLYLASQPACSTNCQNKIFVIKKGESLGKIAQNLEDEGLVRSSLVFQFHAVKLGITRKVQAGDYRLNPKMSPEEIAQELTHGTLDRWITLIEGWRREQIAGEVAEGLEGEQSQFSQEEFLALTRELEGSLFPDTYLIPKEADAQKVVELLIANFNRKTKDLGLDQKTLTLASIVEREAKHAEDRPLVAGVLFNRLNGGMPLQADATVQYAKANGECRMENGECNWWAKSLTREDLQINSPYNTYKYTGLPPGPICNPGLASIKAALEPQETDYWYYLSDREGNIHYAKTHEEHEENIEKYLR